MKQSNLYIPDPQQWIHFFKTEKQTGRGNTIPVQTGSQSCELSISAGSPSQQTVEQAKSELKREDISMSNSGVLAHKKKRRRRRKTSRPFKISRRKTKTLPKTKKKRRKKQLSKNKRNVKLSHIFKRSKQKKIKRSVKRKGRKVAKKHFDIFSK